MRRLALALFLAAAPALAQVPGAVEALFTEVEQCLLARFQEKDVPRTDYAVLLSTRYRHTRRAHREGNPGVAEVLAEILQRCQDPATAAKRPFVRVEAENLPHLVDGGDLAGFAQALTVARGRLAGGGTVAFGTGRVRAADLKRGVDRLLALLKNGADTAALDAAIRTEFDVYLSPGAFGTGEVLFTSYASPVYEGALARDERHRFPLYRSPKRAGLSPKALDRAGVYAGGLAGKGLEFAWLTNRMDEYQIQIEGSGFIELPDGTFLHATYADQNGRKYQSLGKAMVKDGLFPPWEIDNLAVRRYFHAHPEQERPYLERNPSYVFFDSKRLEELPESSSLIGERTVAADRTVFARGQIGFVETNAPIYSPAGELTGLRPWRRFIVADDVGGAIKGAGRMDLYQGQGKEAQALADTMKEPGTLYLFVPKGTEIQ